MKPLHFLVIAAMVGFSATQAFSQVTVYKIDFKKTGRGLNFDFYDGAYFITQAPEGPGNFVFMVSEGASRYYLTSPNAGQLFLTKDGDILMGSIAGTGGVGSGRGARSLLLLNSFDVKSRGVGGGISLPIGDDFKGYFSAYNSLVSTGNGTGNGTLTIGDDKFAGFAEAVGKLDRALTREVNTRRGGVEDGTNLVIERVRRQGYREEPSDPEVGGGASIPTNTFE